MSLSVTQRGVGPAVMLLHAGGLDSRMWGPLVERLEDRLTLIAPDLRGHGLSPVATEPFSHAEDMLALLGRLDIEQCAVVGASFGGGVALQLAGLAPQRVTALGLLAATLFDHDFSREVRAFWAEEEAMLEHEDIDGAVELGVRTWVKDHGIADLVREMTRDAFMAQLGADDMERELPQYLGAVQCRTLAVTGGLDFADFAVMADRIAQEIPATERADVPDAGHLIALERPDAAAALLAAFFQ